MRLKTLLAAGGLFGALLAAAPATVSANIMWCVGDPPTQVLTPAGTHLTVNTYVYAGAKQSGLQGQTMVTATAQQSEGGGTRILVTARPPAGQWVTVVSAVQRGQGEISARASGTGYLTLVLYVPID